MFQRRKQDRSLESKAERDRSFIRAFAFPRPATHGGEPEKNRQSTWVVDSLKLIAAAVDEKNYLLTYTLRTPTLSSAVQRDRIESDRTLLPWQ
jgi:hypothetical protein